MRPASAARLGSLLKLPPLAFRPLLSSRPVGRGRTTDRCSTHGRLRPSLPYSNSSMSAEAPAPTIPEALIIRKRPQPSNPCEHACPPSPTKPARQADVPQPSRVAVVNWRPANVLLTFAQMPYPRVTPLSPLKPHHAAATRLDRLTAACRAAGIEPALGLAADLLPLNRGVLLLVGRRGTVASSGASGRAWRSIPGRCRHWSSQPRSSAPGSGWLRQPVAIDRHGIRAIWSRGRPARRLGGLTAAAEIVGRNCVGFAALLLAQSCGPHQRATRLLVVASGLN